MAPHRIHAVRKRRSSDVLAQLITHDEAGRSRTWLIQTYNLGKGTVLSLLEELRGQNARAGHVRGST